MPRPTVHPGEHKRIDTSPPEPQCSTEYLDLIFGLELSRSIDYFRTRRLILLESDTAMPRTGRLWLCLAAPLATFGYSSDLIVPRKDDTFNFGVIGDSWASGVTYKINGATDYDDNKDGCMRLNHAYGPQLADDFPEDYPYPVKLTFAACSGARLQDMNWIRGSGQHQMDHLPKDTHFVTMQAGGNDAHFADVAVSCLFRPLPTHNYRDQYPGVGDCSEMLDKAEDYILKDPASAKYGTFHDTDNTINDVLQHPSAQSKDFKLYVLGYAHLFNVDSPDSDWCNEASFGVNPFTRFNGKDKLTLPMRARLNDLTTKLNDQIAAVVNKYNSPKVVYISITEAFDGHRFCEKGSNIGEQYGGKDVWFWNVEVTDVAANSKDQKALDQEFDAAFLSTPSVGVDQWNMSMLLDEGDPQAESGSGPHQGTSPGVRLRPCHPKEDGHKAIKDVLKNIIAKDYSKSS